MYDFVDKWTTNPKVANLVREYIPSYLSQFKETEKGVICKLLENVHYYNDEDMYQITKGYQLLLDNLIKTFNNDYIICVSQDDSMVNHNTNKFVVNISKSFKIINNALKIDYALINKIIIIDDYCGSGDTIVNFLTQLNQIISRNINVYYMPIFITIEGDQRIKKQVFSNLSIQVCQLKINYGKYLSDNSIYSEGELEVFINACKSKNIDEKYLYGYNHTEDILSTKHFTPNNSLGILWYSERLYKPLFRRDGQRFNHQYKYLTEQQINYINNLIKRTHTRDSDFFKFAKIAALLYMGFSKQEISDFLNIINIDVYVSKLIINGVLIPQNKKYTFGKNASDYLNIDKIEQHIQFGNVQTQQDIVECNLRSLIS